MGERQRAGPREGPFRRVLGPPYRAGRYVRSLLQDAALGIRTEDVVPFRWREVCPDGARYEPMPYWLLGRVVRRLVPTPDDVVFDIGCGRGRVVAVFARYPVRRVVGVELDPELARAAADNARRVRGRRAPVEIRCCDARGACYDDGTIFVMCNPFGRETLGHVLGRMQRS